MNEIISKKLAVLTSNPGVYIMKNNNAEVIYVGKAKNLKNRVSQYFVSNSSHSLKVVKMVSHIADFEYIVTASELEALILENNLIKQYQPKYNILLKDDKNYPYIVIDKNADYPKFALARRRADDSLKYFGPFKSAADVRQIIKTLNEVFGLYSCNHKFPRDFNKNRPCLNYHIGKCSAVCTGKISKSEYANSISQAISFLNGDYKKLIAELKATMQQYSNACEFEKAAQIRDRINSINRLESKQIIVFKANVERDIIAFSTLEDEVCFSVMNIRAGKLVFQDTLFISSANGEQDLMGEFIKRYYTNDDIIPNEIIVETLPEQVSLLSQWLSARHGKNVRIFCAMRGENVRLVNMCKTNAAEKLAEKKSSGIRQNKLMAQIGQMLGLDTIPKRIEMYDISHFGGDATVGGMVVWQDGRFKKTDYRRFSFKNDFTNDDYKHTHQMLLRRLDHLNDNQDQSFSTKPDIIFVDGGLAHLQIVHQLVSQHNINVFGLVKDKKHKTRAIVSLNGEVDICTTPSVFKFFTELQDEVHRFAISYMHKTKRKGMVSGGLKSVQGIGDAKYKALIKEFKTVSGIKNATADQLIKVSGITPALAKRIQDYFNGE